MVAPHLEPRLPDNLVRTRVALASDPDCPPAVLEVMAHDTDNVVLAVVSNPNCTLTALATAAEHRLHFSWWSSDRIMYRIADHPLMDEALLRRFAIHFPGLIINHPLCPPDLLVDFSRSRSAGLRECAVSHEALPADALLATIGDLDGRVSRAIIRAVPQRGYETIRQALVMMSSRNRQRLVRRLNRTDIERLSADPDERIRYAVASVCDDPDMLRRMAADPHGRVRRAVTDRVVLSLAS